MSAPPGNLNGVKRNRMLGDALKRVLTQNPKRLEAIIEKTLTSAEAGEEWAQKLVYERVDGKLPQPIVGDDEEPALRFARVVRHIVDPKRDANAEPPNG